MPQTILIQCSVVSVWRITCNVWVCEMMSVITQQYYFENSSCRKKIQHLLYVAGVCLFSVLFQVCLYAYLFLAQDFQWLIMGIT